MRLLDSLGSLAERRMALVRELAAEEGLRWFNDPRWGSRLMPGRVGRDARLSACSGGEWEAREAEDWNPDSWPTDCSRTVVSHWLACVPEVVELASSETASHEIGVWSKIRTVLGDCSVNTASRSHWPRESE